MARPAPKDLDYAPTQAKSFTSFVADIDLTTQFPGNTEFAYGPSSLVVSSTAGGAISVMMQSDAATAVVIRIEAATTIELRGAFVKINTAGTTGIISATAFWQGGPS